MHRVMRGTEESLLERFYCGAADAAAAVSGEKKRGNKTKSLFRVLHPIVFDCLSFLFLTHRKYFFFFISYNSFQRSIDDVSLFHESK